MVPRIELMPAKKMVGRKLEMTISENRTFELWKSFMPRRHEIINRTGPELYSIQVYDKGLDLQTFNPSTRFEKWAAVEVTDFDRIPADMQAIELKGGLYAVFNYKGTPDAFPETWNYIFHTWLPHSNYELDDREHFEILGEKYRLNDPQSEEEVWIPVMKKQ